MAGNRFLWLAALAIGSGIVFGDVTYAQRGGRGGSDDGSGSGGTTGSGGNLQIRLENIRKRKEREKERLEAKKAVKKRNDILSMSDDQKKSLARVEAHFKFAYGRTNLRDDVREDALRDVYKTLDGIYEPERKATDKLANELLDQLMAKKINPERALDVIIHIGDALSTDQLSKDAVAGLKSDLTINYSRTAVPKETYEKSVDEIDKMVRAAKRNEDKAEKLLAARRDELEKKQKELEEPEEEKKPKQKRRLGFGKSSQN